MTRAPVVLLSCLFLSLGAAACGEDSDQSNQEPATEDVTQTTETGSSGGKVTISMKSLQFQPAEAQVKVGQTIEWVNDDSLGHNVVANTGADFQSEVFDGGETFTAKADRAGTIQYECTLHAGMEGTLEVTQ